MKWRVLGLSSHVICSVFQGPLAGVAQQSGRTSSGLRSAGDPGHLQTRTQRDQDMSGCTDNVENAATNYSIVLFFERTFSQVYESPELSEQGRWPPTASPDRPRLFGFFFCFSLRAFTFFFLSATLWICQQHLGAPRCVCYASHSSSQENANCGELWTKGRSDGGWKAGATFNGGGEKKRSRWKRVDGGGGSLFSLKSVFRRKRGTNFRLKGQSTPKSNLDPSSELQLL